MFKQRLKLAADSDYSSTKKDGEEIFLYLDKKAAKAAHEAEILADKAAVIKTRSAAEIVDNFHIIRDASAAAYQARLCAIQAAYAKAYSDISAKYLNACDIADTILQNSTPNLHDPFRADACDADDACEAAYHHDIYHNASVDAVEEYHKAKKKVDNSYKVSRTLIADRYRVFRDTDDEFYHDARARARIAIVR